MQVPHFGVGETNVLEYVLAALAELLERIGATHRLAEVKRHIQASYDACLPIMKDSLCAGKVEPQMACRDLWNLMGEILVSDDSELHGIDNLKLALGYAAQGHNVMVVQNHRSGADTLVFEALINRHFRMDVCTDWAYMSGHAVNLFLIPLMFTAGLRRFQIFSAKYLSKGLAGMDEAGMARQNQRALLALRRHLSAGGKIVTYYPEGGRGDNCMKQGEPKTVCILQIAASAAKKPLVILPTYVWGAVNVLHPARGINEYNEVFQNASRGRADLHIGVPVFWNDIQPSAFELQGESADGQSRPLYQRLVCDRVLGLVADLAPHEERGYYASRPVCQQARAA